MRERVERMVLSLMPKMRMISMGRSKGFYGSR